MRFRFILLSTLLLNVSLVTFADVNVAGVSSVGHGGFGGGSGSGTGGDDHSGGGTWSPGGGGGNGGGAIHGGSGWPGRPRPPFPLPIPQPPIALQDLCSGSYFGIYSNGQHATMTFYSGVGNSVAVVIQLAGETALYQAQGTCNQSGTEADFAFKILNSNLTNSGQIVEQGFSAFLQGSQSDGATYIFQR